MMGVSSVEGEGVISVGREMPLEFQVIFNFI
jgi:hypothetical protein